MKLSMEDQMDLFRLHRQELRASEKNRNYCVRRGKQHSEGARSLRTGTRSLFQVAWVAISRLVSVRQLPLREICIFARPAKPRSAVEVPCTLKHHHFPKATQKRTAEPLFITFSLHNLHVFIFATTSACCTFRAYSADVTLVRPKAAFVFCCTIIADPAHSSPTAMDFAVYLACTSSSRTTPFPLLASHNGPRYELQSTHDRAYITDYRRDIVQYVSNAYQHECPLGRQ